MNSGDDLGTSARQPDSPEEQSEIIGQCSKCKMAGVKGEIACDEYYCPDNSLIERRHSTDFVSEGAHT